MTFRYPDSTLPYLALDRHTGTLSRTRNFIFNLPPFTIRIVHVSFQFPHFPASDRRKSVRPYLMVPVQSICHVNPHLQMRFSVTSVTKRETFHAMKHVYVSTSHQVQLQIFYLQSLLCSSMSTDNIPFCLLLFFNNFNRVRRLINNCTLNK